MNNVYQEGKDFARSYILPYTELTDKESKFPEESFKKLGEKGFLKLLIPEEYGGLGKGLEEHAQACLAFAESLLYYSSLLYDAQCCIDVHSNSWK